MGFAIEVTPYLGYDVKYSVKRNEETKELNGLWFFVYFAKYPSTWYVWLKESLEQIATHILDKDMLKSKT